MNGYYYPEQDWQAMMSTIFMLAGMVVMTGMAGGLLLSTVEEKPTLLEKLEQEAKGERAAAMDYRALAALARRQGFSEQADRLLEIASDEARHQRTLEWAAASIRGRLPAPEWGG